MTNEERAHELAMLFVQTQVAMGESVSDCLYPDSGSMGDFLYDYEQSYQRILDHLES